MNEHTHGTSGPGSVILELGEGVGALILEAPPGLHGHEIEISPAAGGPRTHSLVRERRTATDRLRRRLPRPRRRRLRRLATRAGSPRDSVTIRGGQATRFRWPEVTPASPVRDSAVSPALGPA